ncbi:MAG: DUF58 domain-containing protein [Myxococcales bacterium]|nr:DUF58 domain-containing protein [Myxococcales bacterium]MDD9970407.1 DUF58 domain-containing protein [Myxococcales bacterium]
MHLDQELVDRVSTLHVRARRAVEGVRSGLHQSPHRGASVIFAEHRDYRPGDDLRLLDWRAYARNDRYTTKHFEQETHLRAHLVLDLSASMSYGEGAQNKAAYAATVLAALGLILLGQGDSVGALALSEEVLETLPARGRSDHLESLLRLLGQQPGPQAGTNLYQGLSQVGERVGKRGLVAIASDLLDPSPDALRPLSLFKVMGHDVIVFHVLHRDELELPFSDVTRFEDPEGRQRVDVDPGVIREDYRSRVETFVDDCRRRCIGAGCRYTLCPTDTPVQQALASTLSGGRRGWV